MTEGSNVYAVKPVKKLSSKACVRKSRVNAEFPSSERKELTPAMSTLVGLLDTRAALATLAAMN
jgi:hypothetical protein